MKKLEIAETIVTKFYDLNRLALHTKSRKREIVTARQIIWFLTHKPYSHYSLENIGKYFDKDHATALHGINTINTLIEVDKILKREVEAIMDIYQNMIMSIPMNFPVESFGG